MSPQGNHQNRRKENHCLMTVFFVKFIYISIDKNIYKSYN